MSANCPSLAIANWPISALIGRTFHALLPAIITADPFQPTVETDNARTAAGVVVSDTGAPLAKLVSGPQAASRIPTQRKTRYACAHDRHQNLLRISAYRRRGPRRFRSGLAGRQCRRPRHPARDAPRPDDRGASYRRPR